MWISCQARMRHYRVRMRRAVNRSCRKDGPQGCTNPRIPSAECGTLFAAVVGGCVGPRRGWLGVTMQRDFRATWVFRGVRHETGRCGGGAAYSARVGKPTPCSPCPSSGWSVLRRKARPGVGSWGWGVRGPGRADCQSVPREDDLKVVLRITLPRPLFRGLWPGRWPGLRRSW